MHDLISRADAIKAMADLEQEDIEKYSCSIPDGFDGERASEVLKKLPPATPKKYSDWIDFLCDAFNISRTSAKDMYHAMVSVKRQTISRNGLVAESEDENDCTFLGQERGLSICNSQCKFHSI